MARMSFDDAQQFETSGAFDVFTLADDGDSDRVQFLMNSPADVLAYTYHGIEMTSKNGRPYERKVGCLCTSKESPEGTCPLCDNVANTATAKVKTAYFIPMYSHSQKKIVLWERSSKFINTNLGGFFNRMIRNGTTDFRNLVVEVVRQGRKGDTSTVYQFYPMERDTPVDVSELEIPDAEGSLIASWSKEEMQNYVVTGAIPSTDSNVNQGVQRRDRTQQAPMNQPAYGTASQPQTGAPVYNQPASSAPNSTGTPPAIAPANASNFQTPAENPADYF